MNSNPLRRRFLKPLLVTLAAGVTLSAYAATKPDTALDKGGSIHAGKELAALTVSQPSTFSFVGVGAISLFGMLATRRRFRGVRG